MSKNALEPNAFVGGRACALVARAPPNPPRARFEVEPRGFGALQPALATFEGFLRLERVSVLEMHSRWRPRFEHSA
eukprot:14779825-Alexandrium_andersonii.AAC.1